MKLEYFHTEKEASGLKDDDGADLFVIDIAIEDIDRREGNTLCVVNSWQIIFTESNEREIVKAQSEIAQAAIDQIHKYCECYELLLQRSRIALEQLQAGKSARTLYKAKMNQVQNALRQMNIEYRTLIFAMNSAGSCIDHISKEWIAENMMNSELLTQQCIRDNAVY